MSILFGLLFARRFYCRTALSFSPGRTGGLLPRINAPINRPPSNESGHFYLVVCLATINTKSSRKEES